MKWLIRYFIFVFFLLGGGYTPFALCQNDAPAATVSTPVFINIPDTTTQPILTNLIKQLGDINKSLQTLSNSENRNAFKTLLAQTQDISDTATQIIDHLKPRLTGYEQALKLIDKITESSPQDSKQKPSAYHQSLIKNRNDLNVKIQQATIIQLEANSQAIQIQQSLSNIQQVQLFTYLPSPLRYTFWKQVGEHFSDDQARINKIYSGLGGLFTSAWARGLTGQLLMLVGFASAILIIFVLRPLAEKVIIKAIVTFIPPVRLRRSLMTLCLAILSSLVAGLSTTIFFTCLGYQDASNYQIIAFIDTVITQLYFCGFVLGLYRGFLAVKRPQWRLLSIGDETAHALSILPPIYSLMIFLLGIVEYINTTSGVSIIGQQLFNGFFACVASLLFLSIPIKLREIGRKTLDINQDHGPDLSFICVAIGLPLFCIVCIATVMSGYIYLGFSMSVWLNWVILIVSTFGLLRMLLHDITFLVFDPDRWLGKKMHLLGVKPQRMEQLSTVTTALITIVIVLLVIASIMSPGDFNILTFIDQLIQTLKNQKIGNFSLSLSSIAEAFLIFILGFYCIRTVRSWLNDKLFPKTSLDNATRNSIDTILNYCCWVIITIIILSILGVTTQNITWIVSALSVGIGFGLQAIVQNFVCGLILLTERPVRIGDTVTINGVKGTVMSIRVRATEIQLKDFSTLIVPNSQFITSSVQNATRSRHLGLVSLKLPVITVKQLEASRRLIMDIMSSNKNVIETPKPYVLFDDITETSLILSVVCYVNHSSNVDSVKSEILSEYLVSITKLAAQDYVYHKESDKLA